MRIKKTSVKANSSQRELNSERKPRREPRRAVETKPSVCVGRIATWSN